MDGESGLEHLGLKYWPFDVVPDLRGRLLWADRASLRRHLDRLLRRLRGHSANTLHLLWADFGAGKTHTLLYLRQLSSENDLVFVTYSALPRGVRNFVDIYRAVTRSFAPEAIASAFESARRKAGKQAVETEIRSLFPPLLNCLRALELGSDAQRDIAYSWLLGSTTLGKKELESASLTSRVRTTDDAVFALSGLIHLFHMAGHHRVMVMIDEFQRVQELRGGVREEINASLHTFFNTCPPPLSLLLSFSFGAERHINAFLNEELISRSDPVRITIPTLSEEDALAFMEDVWKDSLAPDHSPPLDEQSVHFVVQSISDHGTLTPRRLMKAVGFVLSEAAMDLQDGEISVIDLHYITDIFSEEVIRQVVDDKED